MNLNLIQGKLVRWEDDRGFGFIQPDDGGANVFVHISAIDRSGWRPQVGDRLSYTVQTQRDGKIRAVEARLLGVPPPPVFDSPIFESPGFDWSGAVRIVIGLAMLGVIFFWNSSRKDNRPQRIIRPQNDSVSYTSAGSGFASDNDSTDYGGSMERQNGSFAPPGYSVKGNISVNTGKRYYHTPGMQDYARTIIDTNQGEKWFRTEAEAEAAGWGKAMPYQGRND